MAHRSARLDSNNTEYQCFQARQIGRSASESFPDESESLAKEEPDSESSVTDSRCWPSAFSDALAFPLLADESSGFWLLTGFLQRTLCESDSAAVSPAIVTDGAMPGGPSSSRSSGDVLARSEMSALPMIKESRNESEAIPIATKRR